MIECGLTMDIRLGIAEQPGQFLDGFPRDITVGGLVGPDHVQGGGPVLLVFEDEDFDAFRVRNLKRSFN